MPEPGDDETARSQRAVFFRRRCSLSFTISLTSATGRISTRSKSYCATPAAT